MFAPPRDTREAGKSESKEGTPHSLKKFALGESKSEATQPFKKHGIVKILANVKVISSTFITFPKIIRFFPFSNSKMIPYSIRNKSLIAGMTGFTLPIS